MSKFVVSARKYRPARFDEVVGQQHVSQTLKNALQSDHLAHAFLFCGPRGVGKTTCARILAKVINCQNITADHEACNECSSCTAFNENASFNITELDAASNNSVEHIRALIEQVRFQPQQGKYKVFIIDEVHMLSQQAFNAFLKTLEEPPPYAIFILATTEKHKIIPTILSRCQIFDFRRIQVANMVEHLQHICKQENIEAEQEALHIIAQKADGALRDSLSIFDRIVSALPAEGKGDRVITYQDVIENLNVLDYDFFFKMTDALITEDLSGVMNIFNEIQQKGFEADLFINGLAAHFRDVLVSQDSQTLQLLEASDSLKQRYQNQAQIVDRSFLLSALHIANECDVNYKMARNKRLHVEMALIKMTYIGRAIEMGGQAPAPVVSVEKKTPVDNNSSLNTAVPAPAKPPVPQVKEPEPEPLKPPSDQQPREVEKTPVETPKETNQKENTEEKPKANTNGKLGLKKNKYAMPSIASLDHLDAVVEKEIKSASDEIIEVTTEVFKQKWETYSATIQSPSVRNTFKNAVLEVIDEKLIVKVGSPMAKQQVQQESELMVFLRKELNNTGLIMEIHIDRSKQPVVANNKPKVMTTKEKYDLMKSKNPLIEEMRNKFDLKLDQ